MSHAHSRSLTNAEMETIRQFLPSSSGFAWDRQGRLAILYGCRADIERDRAREDRPQTLDGTAYDMVLVPDPIARAVLPNGANGVNGTNGTGEGHQG